MGSFHGNCEIVKANNGQKGAKIPQTLGQDDINKLFESIHLRTSKSLDLPERNASKRPIRATGSHSPGIGFSEPISLKQVLRRFSISQAAEMAAIKRLSMPASPRISEAGTIPNMYKSVAETGCSSVEGVHHRTEITQVTEESTPSSSIIVCRPATQISSHSSISFKTTPRNVEKHNCIDSGHPLVECRNFEVSLGKGTPTDPISARHSQEPKTEPLNQSAQALQLLHAVNLGIDSSIKGDKIVPVTEIDRQLIATGQQEEDSSLSSTLHSHDDLPNQYEKIYSSNMVSIVPIQDYVASLKLVDKSTPKLKRKSRLQSVSSSRMAKGSKDASSTRSTLCPKPVRNKNLTVKKSKKLTTAVNGNSNASHEVNSDEVQSSKQLICQRCKCSLRGCRKGFPADKADADVTKDGDSAVVRVNTILKACEKIDISQSSQSSICDLSSSTTSLSGESNPSGVTCGNRPHTSTDTRWEVINNMRKQNGYLALNHFNLLKKLGSGDIGTVYLAELIGTSFLFAIKVLDNEFLERRKKTARAKTEGEILKMLDHPFLPTLYAQFTSDNLSCLVMEFCPGGDLHVLRQKQPGRYFPEQAAKFYVAEIVLALEYLHMLGIVYRDLKPENVLVRQDGHVMLTDFDLSLRCSVNPTLIQSSRSPMEAPRVSIPCAGPNCTDPFCAAPSCKMSCFSPRLLSGRKLKGEKGGRWLPQLVVEPVEARSNSFVGTHEYLAPEIIRGEGHGSAVDWWTLGVFLYELVYGKTPFRGSGNEETLENVVLKNLKFPDAPIVSFQTRDLIRSLLVKEPEQRLGTETGAAEIKRHRFFQGLNWALVRCVVPPQIPDSFSLPTTTNSASADQLKFELF